MDPKEITKADLNPSSSPGLNAQTVTPGPGGTTGTVPFISSKSLIPVSPVLQKNAVSSSPGFQSEKIVSRNCNGTVVLTSSPSNEAELQLYRVMQRASLLAYYDTLLEMGGDDVQQLCDAGEEEFLEIMALVGMASKPLHVRRLQKALQEWVTSPALFQTPLTLGGPAGPGPKCPSPQLSSIRPSSAPPTSSLPISGLVTSAVKEVLPPCMSPDGNQVAVEPNTYKEISTRGPSPCPVAAGGQRPVSPSLNSNPVLVETQISRLAEIAEALVKTLPHLEPKPQNTKKKICRSLETVMNMAENDPKRMDEIRKYSAIYGRFDCKRNPQKPLTLHEVSVNEAAAQICRFAPALLTRRDDLFSLARQVVRDSGYHFTKTHTGMVPFGKTQTFHWSGKSPEESSSKKARLDSSCDANDVEKPKRQERLERIAEELKILGVKTDELVQAAQQVRQNNDLSAVQALQQEMEAVQNKQTQLLVEQSELLKQPLPSRIYRRNGNKIYSNPLDMDKTDTDDTDSQFSLSNASSPSQEVGDSRDSFYREGDTIANTSNGAHSAVKSPAKQTGKQTDENQRSGTSFPSGQNTWASSSKKILLLRATTRNTEPM